MTAPADVFAVGVLVLALGALGLSVAFEASRLSALTGRLALLKRRLQARDRELFDLKRRVSSAETELQTKQAGLDSLTAERSRLTAAIASIRSSKVEMVHELGDPDGFNMLYQVDLRTAPGFARIDQRRIVFAREIWERTNIALVWADSAEAAMTIARRAFNERSGVQPLNVRKADMVVDAAALALAARAPGGTSPSSGPGPAARAPATLERTAVETRAA